MRTLFAIFAFLKRAWYLVTLAAVVFDTYGTRPPDEMVAFELALAGCALSQTRQLILTMEKIMTKTHITLNHLAAFLLR